MDPQMDQVTSRSEALLVARNVPGVLPYLEYLPPDYATTQRRYPTLIFLHGKGQKGSDLEALKVAGPPKEIAGGSTMTFTVNGVTESFIVLAPQLPAGNQDWWGNSVGPILNQAITNYRSDPDRIYITGLSLGGIGAYDNAANAAFAPQVAAIAPVAGRMQSTNFCVLASNHIAVWAFHGDADTEVPYAQDVSTIASINGCSANPPAVLRTYAGVSHNSWDLAYRTDHLYDSPNLYEWLLMQRRGGGSPTNHAPSITTSGATFPANIVLGSNLAFQVGVSDQEQDSFSTLVRLDGATLTTSAGTSIPVTLTALALGTHSVAITSTDAHGLAATLTLAITVNPVPSGNRVFCAPSMIVNEAGVGDATTFCDEQALAGDPASGSGGQPTTGWQTAWNPATFPAHAYIDLDAPTAITSVWFFDTNGAGDWELQTGSPGNWSAVTRLDLSGYMLWKQVPVNATTQFIRLTQPVMNSSGMNEVVIYGLPSPAPVKKLTCAASYVVNETTVGAPGNFCDQQALAGDPANGTGGQPLTGWQTEWNPATFPASAYIDLQSELEVTELWAFDTNGPGDWTVQTATAVGAWDAPRNLDLSGYLRWIKMPIGKRARYIRLTQPVMNSSGVGEVVLYGRP
jgi:hypothetical protein